MTSPRRYRSYVIIVIAVSGLLSLAMAYGLFRIRQDEFIDLLFSKKIYAANRVLIVAIDDQSIHAVGQWPWPRAVFGDLVTVLKSAKTIGIDVNFKESSRVGPADDLAFARAIKNSGTPVVLNAEINAKGQKDLPIEVLQAVSLQAFPNLIIDPDNIARSILPVRDNFSGFALQISRLYDPKVKPPNGLIRVNYIGPSGTIPSISIVDVLQNKVPRQFFENKIVLIGATAPDLQDFHGTPAGIMSGVEIQANIAETYLVGRYFTESRAVNMLLVILLSLLTVWLCAKVKRLPYLITSILGLLAIYQLSAFISFDRFFVLDLWYPDFSVIITAGVGIAFQYFSAAKEKKFIQDSFSRYVAPEVVNKLIADASNLKLGGEKREISILFSDIRGFTNLSEAMEPEMVSQFLNRYLTLMGDVVLSQKGMIDKYIGDAIMAIWGAPLDNPNHARDALRSALAMLETLAEFNDTSGKPPIDIGIGVNSGFAVVGNMGSEKRFDYTAIGDNVNLASRLESLNKEYGTNIIVSQFAKDRFNVNDNSNGEIVFRELDRVRVKGKDAPVTIFEIVPAKRQAVMKEIHAKFDQARDDYYSGNWLSAQSKFQEILKQHQDGPSKTLLKRCQEMASQGGSNAEWHGVWEMINK